MKKGSLCVVKLKEVMAKTVKSVGVPGGRVCHVISETSIGVWN
jgi:hypothetical protein